MDDPRRADDGTTEPEPPDDGVHDEDGARPAASAAGGTMPDSVPPQPDPDGPPPAPELATSGPLSREDARAILDRAAELMSSGDFRDAAVHYRRVVGFDDPAVTAAALLGLGQALYRLDEDDAAVATWESILELPDTPSTYRAWREVAAARVREGDLGGAITAYREAERRAPADEKPEIANRLGWLAKETGNVGASRRYFAKSRGGGPAFPLTWVIIGLTAVVSFMAFSVEGSFLFRELQLDKAAVARGEIYRLWSVALLHGDPIHLLFNMYALYLVGPIVEVLYGSRLFILFYLLCAAGGSVASFVFGGNLPAVGASGAIFGLFGLLLAASRAHHPVLDRQSRSLVSQIGFLILINLAFGFAVPRIDNAAHIGGLVSGLWLGLIFVPGKVPTMKALWQGTATDRMRTMALPTIGTVALVAVLTVGVAVGTANWRGVSAGLDPPVVALETRSIA